MGLLDKVGKFQVVRQLMAADLYNYFRVIESAQENTVRYKGKEIIMLGSNNYLGLTNHPKVKEAARAAIAKYGTGCAGSRFLNGTLDIHIELEEKLARLVGKPKALVFSTGFMVNQGVLSSLVQRNESIIVDRTDHASIIDGARLSFADVRKYKHNDMDNLELVLQNERERNKLIVVDGVFSMEGDIARLPEIVTLAEKYDAVVMVDDAHGIGVLGDHGRGTCDHFGLTDRVHLIMGTFQQVAGLGRRLHRLRRGNHPLHPAPGAGAHVLGQHAARLGRRGLGRGRRDAGRDLAPRGAVAQQRHHAGTPAVGRLQHGSEPDADHPGDRRTRT